MPAYCGSSTRSRSSAEQLQGKDFSPGGKGTGTELLARTFVFPTLGIEPKWYVGGMPDAQAAVKDRRIVGMGKASAVKNPDALIMDIMTSTRIRILSWTPEQVQKVQAKYPFLGTVDIPPGTYKASWNEKSLPTWAEGTGMFALARLPEDLAYAFAKAAVEDTKPGAEGIQAAAYPAVKSADFAEMTATLSTIPLHAGTYRYFREIGTKLPDHLKPPETK
ncbi:MAG: hypothetical protein HYU88_11510 [Chloroflexi bacterium]|nr:hypothetical protein [Chloroflexota bacterium]